MTTYSRKATVNGTYLYYKDGKRLPKRKVPRDDLVKLSIDEPLEVQVKDLDSPAPEPVRVDEVTPEPATLKVTLPDHICVVCGEPGTKQRYVNFQTPWVCDEHYSVTLGRIAKIIREEFTNVEVLST